MAARRRRALGGIQPLTLAVLLVGVAVTTAFSLLTLALHHRTQRHLLQLQVREAAAAVAAGLPSIQTVLDDSLQVARATNSPAAFQRFMTERTVAGPKFTSVSLWRRANGSLRQLAVVGSPPALAADGQEGFLAGIRPGLSLQVTPILHNTAAGAVGFADMPPGDTDLIAYAETALPSGRHLPVARSNPFGLIQFALYLNQVKPSDLLEDTGPLPVRSHDARATAPFGDAAIVLVGSSNANLDGGLAASLPWVVLGVGLLLTGGAAATAELLGRRRRRAEELAEENQRLYLEQRNIATAVQHALLPEVPKLEELEVGARYLAGTAGIDVGGDWYDVVCTPGRCTFVVGDVCGRGLRAATTMASLRYATRAYVADGDRAEEVVAKLGRLQDFDGGELFATLLIGEIDIPGRRVKVVNAGHPPLLLVSPQGVSFVDLAVNPPVGVAEGAAVATWVDVPERGLLLAYTDGLVERRDQALTVGLDRLREIPMDPDWSVDDLLDRLVEAMLPDGAVDDTAILAVRWRPDGADL
ncbi:MAG TPA: PP2C family protein-serine/threonine phosphatase [Acidimicrobiales bacterium]|nr:PP2C family protein-serine/threonine phosphatase [Acidimicrobiales bacterium]